MRGRNPEALALRRSPGRFLQFPGCRIKSGMTNRRYNGRLAGTPDRRGYLDGVGETFS